ncbi:YHS domain-containing protein, partial [Hoeflea sp.]
MHQSATVPVDGSVTDPVCGMKVKLNAGKPSLEYKGDNYHFCSQKCHD